MKRWQRVSLLIAILVAVFFVTVGVLDHLGVVSGHQAVAQGLAAAGAAVLFGVIGAVFWGLWWGLKWAFRSLRRKPR